MRDDLSTRSEYDAVPVEDQLILPTHRVHPRDVSAVVHCALADHRFTWRALSCVVRRSIDVDQELTAVMCLPRHRAGGVPGVFAHRKANARPVVLHDPPASCTRAAPLLLDAPVI